MTRAGPNGAAPAMVGACPVCERFIGPATVCPYCDETARRPITLKFLRRGSILLAVVGLALLYLMAANKDIPVVSISSVTPTMDHAYIRVVGTVDANARVGRRDGEVDYLSFIVDDGTGRLSVSAYDSRARELAARKCIPRKGDRVDVAGTLSVRASRRRLYVDVPAHCQLMRPSGAAK